MIICIKENILSTTPTLPATPLFRYLHNYTATCVSNKMSHQVDFRYMYTPSLLHLPPTPSVAPYLDIVIINQQ